MRFLAAKEAAEKEEGAEEADGKLKSEKLAEKQATDFFS